MRMINWLKNTIFSINEWRRAKPVVVVLVDMQEKLVKKIRKGEAERIIPNQLEILRHCNRFNIPIVVLELNVSEHGRTIKILMDVAQGNRYFRLIEKKWNDGFRDTELDSYLTSLGARKLFLIGIHADYCVMETASSAIVIGYEIMTSNEVISGKSFHSSDNSIGWFKANGQYMDTVSEFTQALI